MKLNFYIKLTNRNNIGRNNPKPNVETIQQEFAKSRFNPYIEGGIKELKATGIDERINITLRGIPSKI